VGLGVFARAGAVVSVSAAMRANEIALFFLK